MHEFTVKDYVESQDPITGETTKEWVLLDSFEGEVTTPTGSELMEAMKLTNPLDYMVHMDYDNRIKPYMRVFFGDMELDIHVVLPTMPDFEGEYESLILKCSSSLR
ncbi:phage head closure protein [Virgibacillus sp. C22-A2]|uniref:Phage head closure protein n=1 Tax=Virgibacillus tibetensis TaxID=3042313 RepID=A0ABU6KAF7_9BACI|nr:phage head closure protein [Virgibacillus sp. C22-A2]